MKYNHAYTIGFEVVTEHEEGKATKEELIAGLLKRLVTLTLHPDEIFDACDLPFDTFEIDDSITTHAGHQYSPTGD